MTCITGRALLVGIMKNNINFRNCHPLLPFRRRVFSEICLSGRWWFLGCFKISFEAGFWGEWRVTLTSFWSALKPPDRKTIESLGLRKIQSVPLEVLPPAIHTACWWRKSFHVWTLGTWILNRSSSLCGYFCLIFGDTKSSLWKIRNFTPEIWVC